MSLNSEDFEQNMDAIEALLALDDVDSVGIVLHPCCSLALSMIHNDLPIAHYSPI